MRDVTITCTTDNLYAEKLQEWTNREIQLNRLHEELVAKRESLLQYSLTYVKSQHARSQNVQIQVNNATKRNSQLLQDLEDTEEMLYQEACNPPSPRLTTLQNNYWSMVKSLKPLWEKSLQKKSSMATRKSGSRPRPSKPKRVVKKQT